uniref:Uncharacterized protein n=1 Tax=Meloidogyne enterolobii TaxID=390850 RepID=A0A6V7TT64_MELEN|nr:unnamed protein product [Meloidogyne enterolobii]
MPSKAKQPNQNPALEVDEEAGFNDGSGTGVQKMMMLVVGTDCKFRKTKNGARRPATSHNDRGERRVNVGTSSKVKDPSKMRSKTHTFLTCVSQLAMELDKSMKVVTKNDMVELKSMLGQFTDGYENKTGYRHQYNLALKGDYHDRIGPVGTFAAEMADIQTRREQRLITLEISKHKADSARIAVVAQMADLALKRKHLKDEGVEVPAKLSQMLERWSSIPESGDEEEDEDEDDGAECGDERGDEEANVNDADYSGDEDNEDYSGDEDNEEDASGGYSGYVEKYVNKASIGSGKRKASEYEEVLQDAERRRKGDDGEANKKVRRGGDDVEASKVLATKKGNRRGTDRPMNKCWQQ